MKKAFSKKTGAFVIAALILFFLDFASKFWIERVLNHLHCAAPYYPYGGMGIFHNFLGIDFCISHVINLGSAWGIFSSFPIVLLIVRIAILVGLIVFTLFLNDQKRRSVPLMLIIVGAFGNILDFFLYGGVIDFFHFTLWGYSFPVFNVADTLIFLGVTTLIFQSLISKKKKHAHGFSNQSS